MNENTDNTTQPSPEEKKPRFSQSQYDMLLRCSEKKDITEWNEWRKKNPVEEIWLDGANLYEAHLNGADLMGAHLERADLRDAHLDGAQLSHAHLAKANLNEAHLEYAYLMYAHFDSANLSGAYLDNADLSLAHFENAYLGHAHLEEAKLRVAHLEDANLLRSHLDGAKFNFASVNGKTLISNCTIDKNTDFRCVALDSIRIDAGTKELLEYNGRRMNWEDEYKKYSWYKRWFIRGFWWISDYGNRTGRILGVFFLLSLFFAIVYYGCELQGHPIVSYLTEKGTITVPAWLVPIRALYFSVVTMTTLGFGDIFAYPSSLAGHILLTFQVLFGYILLGALVTRFAVLFSAKGPAGTFSKPEKKETEK